MSVREPHPTSDPSLQPQIRIHKDSTGSTPSPSSMKRSVTLDAMAAYTPDDPLPRISWTSKDERASTDTESEGRSLDASDDTADVPRRTLSSIDPNAMPTSNTSSSTSQLNNSKTSQPTIRSVTSEPVILESPSNGVGKRLVSRSENSAMPHATRPPPLTTSHSGPPLSWQNSNGNSLGNGVVRSISSEFGLNAKYNGSNLHTLSEGQGGLTSSNTSPTLSSGNTTPQFNAAVGRANTGKSGRVIDKLMGENDMLKRDLKVAQLNTDECRQATRMAEEKMETMASDYEAKLHQANITTSMLKRRDRQIEDLKGQLEGEKRKAQAAQQSEGYWKRELDETVSNTRERVQTAEQLAMLMEGRVLTMSNHWKEQGTEVNRTVGRLGKEIKSLVKDRQNDDKQIQRLNNLCEQQNEQLKKLVKEKEAIQQHFDEYKTFQEESLAKIKADTAVMEAHNIAITKTATETLGELRWALAVNKNLRAEPPE